ncbi:DUF4352 domain-containing protein [Desulfosporosinus sp.]|uniref:DUF4352 domain-containing protein n=1 Tax=Desulfosporosinus sp. TaxID=157907 RepID=UPI0025B95711|nr:DUF4352 domain-containing protein [Desulfosporosinus sp.]MBC2723324.1 DUF4352 domain-containing protein [Desulfosporosinus sp.]
MKKIIYLLLCIGLMVSMLGCGSPTATPPAKENTSNTSTPDPTPPTTPAPEPKNKNYAIGDTFKLGDLQYKVNGIRTTNGNQVMKPKDGNTFLLIDLTIENQGNVESQVSSMMSFKLVDKDGRGQEYSIGAMTDGKGQLDGSIASGRKLSGELGYEVSKGSQTYELEVISSPINGETGFVEIPMK